MAEMENVKIPLPKFLKLLTNNDVPISKAMNLSAKIYKTYNTGAQLAQLNDLKLLTAGIDQKEDRKIFLNALRDSGYLPKDPRRKVQKAEESSSTPSSNAIKASTSPKLKRKRFEDVNELLPTGPVDEVHGSLEFEEILDEQVWFRLVGSTYTQ
ncbi:hypothetical protein H0H81_011724 [Sphagnurus paluster]|uniref:Uncharacterized protein n=1 Tax=Sphagnurus paluster TaxID=117069 RepID=A0A9P7GJS4_9AGAR|nr:hypothetical protein H0H81_011724 [Sphagnurus paluster]